MKTLSIILIVALTSLFSCKKDNKPIRYEAIEIDSIQKPHLDSSIAVLQSLNIHKDSSFNIVCLNDSIEVNLFNLKEVGLLASIILNDTINENRTAYTFKIDNDNKWTFINSLIIGNYLGIFSEDINFDNKKEIVFSTMFSCSRIAIGYDFISNTPDYKLIAQLGSTDSIGIDYKKKEITTFTDGGNFGTNEMIFYKWIDNELIPIKKYSKTFMENYPNPKCLLEKYELKNDSLTLVKSNKLKIDEYQSAFDLNY